MEKKLKTTTTKKTNRWWLDSALQNIFCWLLGYGINFEFGTKQLFHSAFFFFFLSGIYNSNLECFTFFVSAIYSAITSLS